jgi:uncharacterized delta-60 repeat protein
VGIVCAFLATTLPAVAQSLDALDAGPDGLVHSIIVQPDQRILIAGEFTTLGGEGPGSTVRQKVARLNADGSVDTTFNPGSAIGPAAQVLAMVLQPDGKVVVAGADFVNGNIVRLNADGSPDATFTAATDGDVFALALQADGTVVVGGAFSTLSDASGGTFARAAVGRLNPNGTVDATFDPGTNGSVNALLVQDDGRILVGGAFTTLGGGGTGGTTRHNIGRLETNGAIDAGFNPGAGGHPSAQVTAFAMQPDGLILVGGRFTTLGGGGTGSTARNNLGRLAPNGTVDSTFVPDLQQPDVCSLCTISIVRSILVLPSRRILVGGLEVASDDRRETTTHLARLYPTGALDLDFFAPVDEQVLTLVLQLDGQVLVGGEFVWDQFERERLYLARIHPDTHGADELFANDSEPGSAQGFAVALSTDGNTAIVGGPNDGQTGAAWIWVRRLRPLEGGGVEVAWERQGAKLVGSSIIGEESFIAQGQSVSISADGNTAIVGGSGDNDSVGAAWIWVRNGNVWTQQAKLVGTGAIGAFPLQGTSVALSHDGNTAIVGGTGDNGGIGAAWVYTRSGVTWTQQAKLVGSGYVGSPVRQGTAVALSQDGNTAIVGGNRDDGDRGAAWIWTRSGGVWTQQGSKIVSPDHPVEGSQGVSTSLSADGNTALVGGTMESESSGAAWVWTRSAGAWSQQGSTLVGFGVVGPTFGEGVRVALSADGNTAVVGWHRDDSSTGAAWVWTRRGSVWTQRGGKLVADAYVSQQGTSVASSADGATIISGGGGASWVFSMPTVVTLAASNVTGSSATLNATINANGNAVSASFDYGRSASYGRSSWVSAAIGPGLTGVPATVTITGLQCGTLYHVRAVAGRDTTTYGADVTFSTVACPPDVTTLPVPPEKRAPFSVVLDAVVDPNGAETTVQFDYGLTPEYGSVSASASAGAGTEPVTISIAVSGLSCATTYYYRARATNAGGTSIGTGLSFTTSACAPTILGITPGNRQLVVAFTAGADGGAPITHYEYSLNGGGWIEAIPLAPTSPVTIPGLENGTSYSVRLRAVNANYKGAASEARSGTPSTTPGAPAITGITPGNGQLQIAFVPPGDDGGNAITNYDYSLDDGNGSIRRMPASTASPLVVIGLSNDVTYPLRLRAVNVNGPGEWSAAVIATPRRAPDESTDPFNPGANGEVSSIVVQTDGKILVGGRFTMLGGGTGSVRRNNLGRLNADGSVDMAFDPGRDLENPEENVVTALAMQRDGRILVAWDGPDPLQIRRRIGRLNSDGSVDDLFTSAANGTVLVLTVQSDGKILVGGSFTALGAWWNGELYQEPRHGIGRFNADGTVDTTFNPGTVGTTVRTLTQQPDGRILVGGSFSSLGPGGGAARSNIARLNVDGSLDPGFDPGAGGGLNPTVRALSVVGSAIVVGGRFAALGGGGSGTTARRNIGVLHLSGALDTSFVPADVAAPSDTLPIVEAVLPVNGQILVGGYAVAANGALRHLARLNADGSLDTGFDPNPDGRVNALAMQPDWKIVVGGAFTSIGGSIRPRIARLGAPVPGPFTDDPIIRGVTPLKAQHVYELRAHVTALRGRFGLTEVSWTDPALTGVPMRTTHIQELRDALRQAYDVALAQGLNVARPIFTDDPLASQGTVIRAAHIEELRAAVRVLEQQ